MNIFFRKKYINILHIACLFFFFPGIISIADTESNKESQRDREISLSMIELLDEEDRNTEKEEILRILLKRYKDIIKEFDKMSEIHTVVGKNSVSSEWPKYFSKRPITDPEWRSLMWRRWGEWCKWKAIYRSEWIRRNRGIAQDNIRVLEKALDNINEAFSKEGVRIITNSKEKTGPLITPGRLRQLESETLQFSIRQLSTDDRLDIYLDATAEFVYQQSDCYIFSREGEKVSNRYPYKLRANSDSIMQAFKIEMSIFKRRTELKDDILKNCERKMARLSKKFDFFIQKRFDLKRLTEPADAWGAVIVGDIRLNYRLLGFSWKLPWRRKGDEKILTNAAYEAYDDFQNLGYKPLMIWARGGSTRLTHAQNATVLRYVGDPDFRAFAIVAHGTQTDMGARVEMGEKDDGSSVPLKPKQFSMARKGKSTSIVIIHACNQGNYGAERIWKNVFNMEPDGFFYSWDEYVTPKEILTWQKKWTGK